MFTEKELKRRLRRLKALERLIRFGPGKQQTGPLLWERYFDLHTQPKGNAVYSLKALCQMGQTELEQTESAFLWEVCRLAGQGEQLLDADDLSLLGLSPGADKEQVKKRFRELALSLHPDMGGDAAQFRELMETYQKLVGKYKRRP